MNKKVKILTWVVVIIAIIFLGTFVWLISTFEFDSSKQFLARFSDKSGRCIYTINIVDEGALSSTYFQVEIRNVKNNDKSIVYNFDNYDNLKNIRIMSNDTIKLDIKYYTYLEGDHDTVLTFLRGETQ